MLGKEIIFELSALYSQEENEIAEWKGRTLIEYVRSSVIGGRIPDKL